MKYKCFLSRAVLLLFILAGSSAGSAANVKLDNSITSFAIGKYCEYIIDRDKTLSFNDIRLQKNNDLWIQHKKETIGFGFTNSRVWVRFTIENTTDNNIECLLIESYPLIDKLSLYEPAQNENYRMTEVGDSKPFSERVYDNRNFVFPLNVPARSTQTYYFMAESTSSMSLPLAIWSNESFLKHDKNEERFLMLFYGIFLIMIMYNLFIFLFVRHREYLYYVLFVLFFTLFVMTQNGNAFQFFWPDFWKFANYCIPVFLILLTVFGNLFSVKFLELKKVDIFSYRLALIVLVPNFIFFAVYPFLVYFNAYAKGMILSAILTAITVSALLFIGWRLTIKKNRNSYFYSMAFTTFLVGCIFYLGKTFALLPSMFITDWSMHIGAVVMITLLSLALADRIKIMNLDLLATKSNLEDRTTHLIETMNKAESISNELFGVCTEQDNICNNFSRLSQEQAAMSEELASTFEEITASIDSIDTSVKDQESERRKVMEMVDMLKKTQGTVLEMSKAAFSSISDIAKSTDDTGENIDKMVNTIKIIGEGGKTVNSFISIIEDITDKINLLSLNASIEAARAGEHGKGFAVVADEIGKLATLTADNSNQISGQIVKIIADIDSSIILMNTTRNSTGKIFSKIDLISAKVNSVILEMENLSSAIENIIDEAKQLDAISKVIAASTGEQKNSMGVSSESALHLSSMANEIAAENQKILQMTKKTLEKAGDLNSVVKKID